MRHHPVTELLALARRRYFWIVLAAQSADAVSIGLGGLVLLLLLGTQVLDPWWPFALGLLAFGLILYRVRQSMPSRYQLAQWIDQRQSLHDALSTAYFYSSAEVRFPALPAVREKQWAEAESLAGGIDLKQVFPWQVTRKTYATAALALVAVSLFAWRYGSSKSLDLRAPIVALDLEAWTNPLTPAAPKKTLANKQRPLDWKESGLAINGQDPTDPLDPKGDAPIPSALQEGVKVPSADGRVTDKAATAKANAPLEGSEPLAGQEQGDQAASGQSDGDGQSASNQKAQAGNKGEAKEGPPQAPQNGSGNEQNSVLSKLKDALANMMNKMQNPGKQGEPQQNAGAAQPKAQSASSQKGQQQKGSQTPGKAQGDENQAGDQQGEQEGEGGQKTASAQGKDGDKSGSPNSPDAKSGVGKQDGAKELRNAEQLAAMGKISELLGKRAANMTGEITVEVPSGKQGLQTQYSKKTAAHGDAGSELHRDEIPLAYQHYVQQYFEQVHKAGAAKKTGVGAAQ